MYLELLAASFVIFRWNHLESDVATAKYVITHVLIPFAQSGFHHMKDSCCSRKPQPGMRPPSLQRPTGTLPAAPVETNAKTE